jgi:hypothetical protein
MKKFAIAAITVAASATMAVASSLSVPWFVDGAGAAGLTPGNGTIGVGSGVVGIVTLKSNVPQLLTLSIEYFSPGGDSLGPQAPYNTFTINPRSALAFRPVVVDPFISADGIVVRDPVTGVEAPVVGISTGLEDVQGVQVPKRPRSANATTPIIGHPTGLIDFPGFNGSITVTWQGGPQDVQGQVVYFRTQNQPDGQKVTISYGHLLPPGF